MYRYKVCKGIYNLYGGTVFEVRHFHPEQVVLSMLGVCQGKSTAQLACGLGISRTTATEVSRKLQTNAERVQPQTPLYDLEVETDEMFQNAGEKGDWHGNPDDRPRRRANTCPTEGAGKQRGWGTYDNDRPPVCAVMGQESRKVRIRVMKNTQGATLCPFVERFTKPEATTYTDEYESYNKLRRLRLTVCHSDKEWARDADGDGVREVHVNSNEGGRTGLRNFLRLFRGVHKKHSPGYVAIYEPKSRSNLLQPCSSSAFADLDDS